MKKEIVAGLAIRGQMRRFLLSEGIDFVEDKGWLDSVFYLKCPDEKFNYICRMIEEREKRLNQ